MDYKYIEQLLERYWLCETSQAEERLLRDFFAQDQLPAHLAQWKPIFDYQHKEAEVGLTDEFEKRLMNRIGSETLTASRASLRIRLRPLWRAAAVVAIFTSVALAAQRSFDKAQETQNQTINYASYQDTYTDPRIASQEVEDALRRVQMGLKMAGVQLEDSVIAVETEE